MIKKLRGVIVEKDEDSVILDVKGIGFEVFVAHAETFEKGKDYEVYIFEDIKENEINLFGFLTKEELNFFKLIINKISGVGPKKALDILSSLSLDEITNAIKKGDHTPFLKVKGLGEKTAKRIVLEIGGELKKLEETKDENLEIITESLISLGFEKNRVKEVVKNLDKTKPIEEMMKEGIKKLSNEKH
ncbi:Holliday junction branch migration protein RuvA [Caldisericum exile]|uniref:Holliday junction branch migration complex subunit RuvA n=1 Tax=Caldisericum exile (strain DSM 21853 / NBRC 104410 / AZM16c01) TaxID=511051 RepID=A0A7U6GF17_CALEA|nr:Holliday junction branch migration protein RuvA [Caldisericum exile]BAL81212.1 Holliday junction ATP-dependent DNA helicase RuvA [Caldisericum exile AZM16c01]